MTSLNKTGLEHVFCFCFCFQFSGLLLLSCDVILVSYLHAHKSDLIDLKYNRGGAVPPNHLPGSQEHTEKQTELLPCKSDRPSEIWIKHPGLVDTNQEELAHVMLVSRPEMGGIRRNLGGEKRYIGACHFHPPPPHATYLFLQTVPISYVLLHSLNVYLCTSYPAGVRRMWEGSGVTSPSSVLL